MDGPSDSQGFKTGKLIVVWRLKQWTNYNHETVDWGPIAKHMEESRDILNLLDKAAHKPAFDSGFVYTNGFRGIQVDPMMLLKEATQLLESATLYELEQSNLDLASQYLFDSVRLASLQSEPLIINQLVRRACVSINFWMTWQALQFPGWTDAQLAALQSAWDAGDPLKDMADALIMERAVDMDMYRQAKGSDSAMAEELKGVAEFQKVFGDTGNLVPANGMLVKWVYVPVWRMAWVDQDEAHMLQQWETSIAHSEMIRTNSWKFLTMREPTDLTEFYPPFFSSSESNQINWYDRLRFLLSNQPDSVNDKVLFVTVESKVEQQLAVAAIAISRYRLRTGRAPPDLQSLTPDFLSSVPNDSMDGKPLRYRRNAVDSFTLYSVGENGTDDGGDPTPLQDKKRRSGIWKGRDAVWPAAAPGQ